MAGGLCLGAFVRFGSCEIHRGVSVFRIDWDFSVYFAGGLRFLSSMRFDRGLETVLVYLGSKNAKVIGGCEV